MVLALMVNFVDDLMLGPGLGTSKEKELVLGPVVPDFSNAAPKFDKNPLPPCAKLSGMIP